MLYIYIDKYFRT